MQIRKKLQTLGAVLAQKGPLAVLNIALKKVFPSGNYILSWDARQLFCCRPPFPHMGSLWAEPVPPTRIGELEGFNNLGLASMEAAIRRGETCWVLRQDQAIVAYVWISGPRERISSDTGYRLGIKGDFAYWWRDVYVDPQYRGRGLVAALFASWAASLPAEQVRPIYTEVAPDNSPSLRAHRKLGFQDLGRLHMFCLLGARFYHFRGEAYPALGFRFYPRNIYFAETAE